MEEIDWQPAVDERSHVDRPTDAPADRTERSPSSRRNGWWIVVGVGFLAVLVVGVAITLSNGRRAGTSSVSHEQSPAPSEITASQTAAAEEPAIVRLARLRDGAVEALQRVAPGATLGPGDDNYGTNFGVARFQVLGEVQADGRRGAINIIATRAHEDRTCSGFAPAGCRLTTGPRGESIWMITFERPKPEGQPRDLETQVTVSWPSGSLVMLSVDNGEAPPSLDNMGHTAPRTGQDPPLTVEQVIALASDPALDVCATECSTNGDQPDPTWPPPRK
jgi:hypothetical protein